MIVDQFHWLDYTIFGGTLLISVLIGVFYAVKGQKTTKEFLVGDRKMPVLPTALSLLVSFQSGILILGISSEMYVKGTTFVWYMVGIVVGIPLAATVYQPIFYKLQLTSAYEVDFFHFPVYRYLEYRFHSKFVRYIGSILFMLSTLMYMAIVLYAPAVALSGVSGINLELLIVISGLACTFYTALGGLKAVVWTDAFQAVIMYAGFMAIIVRGVLDVGGAQEVWRRAYEGGRIITELMDEGIEMSLRDFADVDFADADPFVYMNFWSVLFGTALGWMSVYGTNQSAVQRYTSLSSLKKAQLSLLLVVPGILTLFPLVCISGLVMYAYYHKCDPLNLGAIESRDQLLPHFTVEVMKHIPGMPGVFLACLYSGTLSTVSSGVNSLAAVVWEDFLKDTSYARNLSPQIQTRINKITALVFGLISIGLACVSKFLGGVLQAAMTVLSMLGGPLAGLFLFGMIVPWANRIGGLVGVIGSSIIMAYICIGAQIIKPYQTSLPRQISGCSNVTLQAAGMLLYDNGTYSQDYLQLTTNEQLKIGSDVELSGPDLIFKLSYKLYGLSGILLVFLIGIPASIIASRCRLDDRDVAYLWPGLRHMCVCCLPRSWVTSLKRSQTEIAEIEAQKRLRPNRRSRGAEVRRNLNRKSRDNADLVRQLYQAGLDGEEGRRNDVTFRMYHDDDYLE